MLSLDGKTELFEIFAGVLQADTLAPYLVIMALDYALVKAMKDKNEELGFRLKKRQSRRIGLKCIMNLDFADDISLLSEEINQAQELLLRVERAAAEVGLMANPKKTKGMAFNRSGQVDIRTIDGSKLEVVDDYISRVTNRQHGSGREKEDCLCVDGLQQSTKNLEVFTI